MIHVYPIYPMIIVFRPPELCSPAATRAQWLWGWAPRVVAARGIPGASQRRSALGANRCEAQEKWVKLPRDV